MSSPPDVSSLLANHHWDNDDDCTDENPGDEKIDESPVVDQGVGENNVVPSQGANPKPVTDVMDMSPGPGDSSYKGQTSEGDIDGEVPVQDKDDLDSQGQVQGQQDGLRFHALPRDKRFIVITFSLVNFCLGAFYSLLGPFFPNEASAKGVSSTVTGLIFGVFELIIVIVTPVYGNYLTQIGAKFMYCTGLLVCGSAAILFGFLDGSPDGTVYIVMCFLVRSVEGLGAAGFVTASFAIMAHTFPDNVATMFGTLELFSGLGMMVGPPIGGALYQLGGFRLPFVSSGAFMLLVGVISVILLPSVQDLSLGKGRFILGLLRIPAVCIMGLCLIVGAASIGFMDVGMSVYLKGIYGFTPVIMGLVFLVAPGVYAITAPLWGFLADKKPALSKFLMIFGYMLGGLSLSFLGPAPFYGIANDHLWLLLVALAFVGLGIGTLVISFQIITDATRAYGYPDTLETYGLISGLFNSFFSFGAFIGPLLGGYFIDLLEFPLASTCMGAMSCVAALVYLCYCLSTSLCGFSPRTMPISGSSTPISPQIPTQSQSAITSSETSRLIDNESSSLTSRTPRNYSTIDV